MVVEPLLPAYAHISEEASRCAAEASSLYDVPELLLHAVLLKEDGRPGKCSRANSNGTRDCGLAQINTLWNKHFKTKYGIQPEQIRDDVCTNIYVSAYILKHYNQLKKGDWFDTIVSYNIGPYKWDEEPGRYAIGHKYATDVVNYWWSYQRYVDHQHGIQRKDVPEAYFKAPGKR